MASTTTYQHFPLDDKDAIRVLRLFPSGNPEDPIRVELLPCWLTKVKLESPIEASPINDLAAHERHDTQSRFKCSAEIPYDALSYAWGDLKDTHKPLIYIGEHATSSLPVTCNCFNALRALRQGERSRYLWIDAVCINQTDLEERSHQVRTMARIYASASCTIIYLGEHTESSRILFQWMSEEMAHWVELDRHDDPVLINFQTPLKVNIVHGMRELLQRPWFRRVWVLQEVYLSRKPLVLCGGDVIPCPTLIEFWEYILNGDDDSIDNLPIALNPQFSGLDDSQFWPQFLYYIGETREFLASDSRDRIFALKALLGSQQDELDQLIDYTKSFEEISVELALELIDNFGIELLKLGRQGHGRDMPSWVPDWSQNSKVYLEKWGPSSERISLKHSVTSNQLHLRGWRNGQIRELGVAFSFEDSEDLRQQMLAVAYLAHSRWAGGDMEETKSKSVLKYFPGMILAVFLALGKSGREKLLTGAETEDVDQIWMSTQSPAWYTELINLMQWLNGWRIFLCTGTNHIGLAPSITAKGDILVSVEGFRNPCIVRPLQTGRWRLISGECFAMCYDPHALDKWHIQPRDMREQNEAKNGDGDIVWRGGLGETEEFIIV